MIITFSVLISEILLSTKVYAKAEAVLYNLKPASLKQYSIPDRHFALGHLNSGFAFKQKSTASMPGEDVFKIEASDAIDVVKYSQPDIAYSLFSLNGGMKVPSLSFSKHKLQAQNPSRAHFQEEASPISHALEKDILKPVRDMRYLDSAVNDETSALRDKETVKSENKNLHPMFEPQHQNDKATHLHPQTKNNFTDANDNLVSVSSDAILSYEVPVTEFNDSSTENSSQKLDTEMLGDVPSHDYSGYNTSLVSPESKIVLPEHTTQNSVQLNTHVYTDYTNRSNMSTEIVSTSIFPSIMSDENVTNSLPSTDSEKKLSSGTVAGIVIAVLICVTLLSSKFNTYSAF